MKKDRQTDRGRGWEEGRDSQRGKERDFFFAFFFFRMG